MGIDKRYPDDHASFLERCHDAGQTRPTPKSNDRVNLRHGVSRVRLGMRHSVGIIFHDAA